MANSACFVPECGCARFSSLSWDLSPRCRRCQHAHAPAGGVADDDDEAAAQVAAAMPKGAAARDAVDAALAQATTLAAACMAGRCLARHDGAVFMQPEASRFAELAVGVHELHAAADEGVFVVLYALPPPPAPQRWLEVARTESQRGPAPAFRVSFTLPTEPAGLGLRLAVVPAHLEHQSVRDHLTPLLGLVETSLQRVLHSRVAARPLLRPVPSPEAAGDEDAVNAVVPGTTILGAATLWVHARRFSPTPLTHREVGCVQRFRLPLAAPAGAAAAVLERMATPPHTFTVPLEVLRVLTLCKRERLRYWSRHTQEQLGQLSSREHKRLMQKTAWLQESLGAYASAALLCDQLVHGASASDAAAGASLRGDVSSSDEDEDEGDDDEDDEQHDEVRRRHRAASAAMHGVQAATCFKRSTLKKARHWEYVPVNLCLQTIEAEGVRADAADDADVDVAGEVQPFASLIVTHGAFTATALKYKEGGVVSMRAALRAAAAADDSDEEDAPPAEDAAGAGPPAPPQPSPGRKRPGLKRGFSRRKQTPAAGRKSRAALAHRLEMRLEVVTSQALTALCAGVYANLCLLSGCGAAPRDDAALALIESGGVLVQLESLLSTRGKEIAMLEDHSAAVAMLNHVQLAFREEQTPGDVHLQRVSLRDGGLIDDAPDAAEQAATRGRSDTSWMHDPSALRSCASMAAAVDEAASAAFDEAHNIEACALRLHVGLPREVLAALPITLREGDPIPVTAVLVTQGINEMQSVANKLGEAALSLQDNINRRAAQALGTFYAQYERLHADAQVAGEVAMVRDLLLRSCGARTKEVAVLTRTADLCRRLGAVRLTCCKSGKDRTSMSATLEQERVLRERLRLSVDDSGPSSAEDGGPLELRDLMRSYGTRRLNVLANTGKDKYAFNALQARFLPDLYKPPTHTHTSNTA